MQNLKLEKNLYISYGTKHPCRKLIWITRMIQRYKSEQIFRIGSKCPRVILNIRILLFPLRYLNSFLGVFGGFWLSCNYFPPDHNLCPLNTFWMNLQNMNLLAAFNFRLLPDEGHIHLIRTGQGKFTFWMDMVLTGVFIFFFTVTGAQALCNKQPIWVFILNWTEAVVYWDLLQTFKTVSICNYE